MATFTRKNVYANGGDFSDPTILWYARGVKALNARKLADPLAWRFYGAIHGFDRNLWRVLGYLKTSEKMPTNAQIAKFWRQCQHGSWYFLPWHRGYLLALEAAIRDAVITLKGPKDWALPYWNYFGGGKENQLPPAFASKDWPDGKGNNPLFIPQRYGPNDDGDVFVDLDQVNLDAMNDPDYTGVASGGDPGFGGVDTGFSHGGPVHGRLESQPHDQVHVLVGGGDPDNPNLPGLMSDPDTAGLDPIFYLHHANIDRLWEVWLQGPVSQGNPTDKQWLKGPTTRVFSMPLPPKGDPWNYTPADMADLSKLNYTYDDLKKPAALAAAPSKKDIAVMTAKRPNVELVGASQQPVKVSGKEMIPATVQMDKKARQKMTASLSAAEGVPDRVFLNLENIRGLKDATSFQVFVNGQLAGTVGLFGVRKATQADEEHGGEGLTHVLEITKLANDLHLKGQLDADKLDVRIVPVKPVPEESKISIGRISVFRQGR